jgi:hypothetical protein
MMDENLEREVRKPRTVSGDIVRPPAALTSLIELPNWVVWKWQPGKNGWTKPPFRVDEPDRLAANNSPATWGSYHTAGLRVLGQKADGIGFVLTDTEIGAIDLDKCRDPDTGEIDAWAQVILDRASHTYSEITVSGTGLRIIGTITGTDTHRKFAVNGNGAAVEAYRRATRFITVSCQQVGDCKQLGNIDDLIDSIVGQYDGAAAAAGAAERRKGKGNGGTGSSPTITSPGIAPAITTDTNILIEQGAPVGQRSEGFAKTVWSLAGQGLSIDQIEAELQQHPDGIAAKYGPRRLRKEIERCYGKWQQAQEHQQQAQPCWPDITKDGEPKRSYRNTRAAIAALDITCQYDEFHDRMTVGGQPIQEWAGELSDAATMVLRQIIIESFNFDPGKDHVLDAASALCLEHRFDPVADYLNGLKWDGMPRLDSWLSAYLGAEDTPLHRAIGRTTLVAAVRRVRQPGCKFDHILTLEGVEGKGKSTAITVLAGVENFSDQTILSQSEKEQQEMLRGVWLFEIADLAGMKRAEVERVKAFASRTHDRARPAYGRRRVDAPRRCIFIATTNEDEYLKSQTGNRRFWPVKVAVTGGIDIDALRRDRDQLWAEAAKAEAEGASLVLPEELWGAARAAQEGRRVTDPWEDTLMDVRGFVVTNDQEEKEERISSHELLWIKLGITNKDVTSLHTQRLKQTMNQLGWIGPKHIRVGGKTQRGYYRPAQADV